MDEVGERTGFVSGNKNNSKKKLIMILIGVLVVIAVIVIIVTASLISTRSQSSSDADLISNYQSSITMQNLMEHLNIFEEIAYEFNGSRSVLNGYNASADYVVKLLKENTNYNVTIQTFPVTTYSLLEPYLIQIVTLNQTLIDGTDFYSLGGYGGLVNVTNVTLKVAANLGCEASDYAEIPPQSVILVKRGVCNFFDKIQLAANVSGIAVLIYNDGTTPEREGPFSGNPGNAPLPSFGISFSLGTLLSELENPTLNLFIKTVANITITRNIIAETPNGDENNIIVVGSHLDSVPAGPGINDNGSGSSTNLELALQLYKINFPNKNKIRFAWWGAEEIGLLGSIYYVNSLSTAQLNQIALNLNFDMLGSPNFVYGIYNGSGAAENIRQASEKIQSFFESYFSGQSLPYELEPFTGRSDYGPFIENGIPACGLAAGADEIKTVEERSKYGGLAETPLDPCYHQSCDTVENINTQCLFTMGQAAAYTLGTLALQQDLKTFLIS
jgi:Zn-dependent M28 family amino/carboxypeptidase